MNPSPRISVCVPVYNAAPYLGECIDSILTQTYTDFELLLADDGSTDGSAEIAASYSDPRIRLIRGPHDYVGTLNRLLDEARGEFIARMDADDVMRPERLALQLEYMEAHPEVDAVSGRMALFVESTKRLLNEVYGPEGRISLHDMVNRNATCHGVMMIRAASLGHPEKIRYDRQMIYAEDYDLWARMIMSGKVLHNMPVCLAYYRQHSAQVTHVHRMAMDAASDKVRNYIRKELAMRSNRGYTEPVPARSSNKLTVILPFANEGEEVGNTVKSIRQTAGREVEIIVCNDQSTDGYDYRRDLAGIDGVRYYFNAERKGVAGSRDYCISLCTTPYFLLLDAHMRFYSKDWAEILVNLLEQDDRVLLCCQGKALEKREERVSEMKAVPTHFGALLPFEGDDLTAIEWRTHETSRERIEEVPAVLGAGYAASKRYWTYLDGLKGLRSYGSDEQLISLKVWLEGGRCLLVKNVVIGHIYRESSPFGRIVADEFFNKILIARMFFPLSWRCHLYAGLIRRDSYAFRKACAIMEEEQSAADGWISYQRKIRKKNIQDFFAVSRRLCPYKSAPKLQYTERIEEVASYLLKNPVETTGIYDGCMGHIIWLSHYNQRHPDKQIEEHIDVLWQKAEQTFEENRMPLNFKNGMLGFGWALIYLYVKGFLEDSPENLLKRIDQCLAMVDFLELPDRNDYLNIIDVLLYINARIQTADKLGRQGMPCDMKSMKAISIKVDSLLRQEIVDADLAYEAFKFKLLTSPTEDKNDFGMSLDEWLEAKEFIPVNLAYGEKGLGGNVMTTSLHAMLRENLNSL